MTAWRSCSSPEAGLVRSTKGTGEGTASFETEEQARDATPPVSSWAAPGVTITSVELRRVAATA
jgi:hypothetical protein